jgi:hypothetical protein
MPIETVVLTTLRLLSIAFTALLGLANVDINFSDGYSSILFSAYLTDTGIPPKLSSYLNRVILIFHYICKAKLINKN